MIADESSREASPTEWWFVQGHYEGTRSGRRDFMASFFRLGMATESTISANGFAILLSVLDPTTGAYETLSQIDPAVMSMFIRLGDNMKQLNLDSQIVAEYIKEIVAYGPPRPIRLEKAKVKLTSNPFCIAWKDFSLCQCGQKFQLLFVEPESRRHCQFHLRPVGRRTYMEGPGEPYLKPVAYATYPRLELTGRIGEEEIRGSAWLDHQWGALGWFVTQPSGKSVLGWDWLGVNLEDGRDLLMMIHRKMKSKRPVVRYAVLCEREQKPRVYENFTAKPFRYWESGVTHIRYPVAWRIRIPEIKANFTFEPSVDNQEIQVFGVMRAIWEGSGTVSGTVAGRPVVGRARLELHGYGYIFDFQDSLKRFVSRIDQRIEEFFPKTINEAQLREYVGPAHWRYEPLAYTEALSRPVWDLMLRKGKHWRPIFGMLMLEALGIPFEPYETLVSVMQELLHTGALIIDDIEDDSLIRRGKECIHRRYGLDVAINAANTVYFLPLLLLSDHPNLTDDQRLRIYNVLVRQFVRLHFGQGLDIYWSNNMTVRNMTRWIEDSMGPKILQLYAHKTGAAVEGTAEVACIIAGSEEPEYAACISFARAFGVAFQIIDDVHNFSDSPGWRKTCGEDLRDGKPTYVIVRALEQLKALDRHRLQRILCSSTLRKKPSVLREGIELVRSSGALTSCRKEAQSTFEKEWGHFSEKLPPSEPKMMLRILCSHLLNLSYGI